MSTLSQPGLGTIAFAYTDAELLASEGGLWANDTVSYGYHPSAPRLRTALTVQPSGSWNQSYGYDLDSQLASALGTGGQSTENLGYTYDAGWNLAQRTQNGVPTAFQVDALNQLTYVGAASYAYDSNGNLTAEYGGAGRSFGYDDENRLVWVLWGSGWYLTEFTYDGLGRMRKRVEKYYSGGQYTTYDTVYYVYDGMRVVQERNSSNTPTVAYTRGSDLSGSLEGAGGIGGLLARSDQYSGGSWNRHVFYHADGSGNITALANSAGTLQALYRYDPYGRATYTWGPLGGANVYRFSSRMFHGSSGLYYYGYRFYDPNLQRWLNRDPIGELGGMSLYGFVRSNPISRVDPLGLWYLSNPFTWFDDEGYQGSGLEFFEGSVFVDGLQATVDGFNPFGDPQANRFHLYDPCDTHFKMSQVIAGLAREAALTAVGGAVLKGAMSAEQYLRAPALMRYFAKGTVLTNLLTSEASPVLRASYGAIDLLINGVHYADLFGTIVDFTDETF